METDLEQEQEICNTIFTNPLTTRQDPRHELMHQLSDEEALPVGGDFRLKEKDDHIVRFSCINQGGIKPSNIQDTLQHALESQIDIQCYSEINFDVLGPNNRIALQDGTTHPADTISVSFSSPFLVKTWRRVQM